MKTQYTSNKLNFEKNTLTELNALKMSSINGGSTIDELKDALINVIKDILKDDFPSKII